MAGIVTAIKKYPKHEVLAAISECNYFWKKPCHKPGNIERMVEGLPRHVLLRILNILDGTEEKQRKTRALLLGESVESGWDHRITANTNFKFQGTTTGRFSAQQPYSDFQEIFYDEMNKYVGIAQIEKGDIYKT